MKTLLKNFALSFLLVLAAACTGDDGDDGGVRDGGSTDVGRDGGAAPDRDRDTIPDDVDNCPNVENRMQLDLDEDGLGNACDSCPAYSNNGTEAPRRQQDCVQILEVEDNDETPQPITLPEGMVVEIVGVVESSSEGVVDHFGFETAEEFVFYRLSLRAGERAPLEPVVVVDSEHYTQTREADGAEDLLREIACYRPGSYTIAVGDRRTRYDGEARGGDDAAYHLVIEPYEPQPASIAMRGRQAKAVDIDLGGPGRIYYALLEFETEPDILEAFETSTRLGRGESTTGVDTVVVAAWAENDNRAAGTTDSGVGVWVSVRNFFSVIIDHHRTYGDDDYEVTLTIRPNDPLEQEPNDTFEDAIVLEPLAMSVRANIGEPASVMAGPPDEDWYAVDVPEAGQIVQVSFGSQSDLAEIVAEAFVDEGGSPRSMFRTRHFTRILPPALNIVAFQEGRYWIRVQDAANDSAPYVGGNGTMGEADFRYGLGARRIMTDSEGVQLPPEDDPVSTDAELSGELIGQGAMQRHPIVVQERARLVVTTTTTAPEIVPHLSLFGPGLVGLFVEGSTSIDVVLEPAEEPYVLGVRNGNDGIPHLVSEPAYTLQLRYLPPN